MEQEDQRPFNLCTCENVAHGELGAIGNEEDLARVIMSPTHFNKNGELKPGAFPLSHISKTGLSLLRIHKMSKQDIVRIAAGIAPSSQSAHSIAVASALQIRAIELPQGAQALCVLDDPVEDDPHAPDNPAHAIAISSLDRSQAEFEPDVLEIQTELLHLFRRTLKRLPDEI